jgi:hypothetical protein
MLYVSEIASFSSESLSLFVVCRILDFHEGDYEECRLLGCGAV